MQEPDVSLEKTTVANKRIKTILPIVLLTRVSKVNWIVRVSWGLHFYYCIFERSSTWWKGSMSWYTSDDYSIITRRSSIITRVWWLFHQFCAYEYCQNSNRCLISPWKIISVPNKTFLDLTWVESQMGTHRFIWLMLCKCWKL
jgi:hypothetical protein